MENAFVLVLAIIAIVLLSAIVPLIGLVAMAYASLRWQGLWAAIVITLFWARWGPIWGIVWPTWSVTGTPPVPPAR